MKKLLAVMLSLMLLIGCVGSAEVETLTLGVNYMGQQLLQALLMAGTDVDGCGVLAVIADAAGQTFDAAVEINPNAITIQSGENTVTITSDTAASVIAAVVSSVIPDNIAAALASFNAEDMNAVMNVAMNEVNTLAQLAMEHYVVYVYEDGEMYIQIDADTVIDIAGEYLAKVAAGETSVSLLAETGIWSALQLPEFSVLQQYAAAFAEQLEQIDAGNMGIDASVQANVYPNGSLELYVTCKVGGNGFYSYDYCFGDEYHIYAEWIENEVTTDISIYAMPGSVNIEYENGSQVCSCDYYLEDGTLNCSAELTDGDCSEAFSISINPAALEINGSVTDNAGSLYFYGEPAIEGSVVKYVLTVESGAETAIAAIAVDMAAYTAELSVNGAVIATLGLEAIDENTVRVYADSNGERYAVTVSYTELENGADYALSLDASMEELTMNIASVELAFEEYGEAFGHAEGTEVSVEELFVLVMSLIDYMM